MGKETVPKKSIGINVLEAAISRISWTFDNFQKISVSFSGGKDSTVMLHLVMDEAIKRNRRVGLLFIDLEAQFNLTIDHILDCYEMYKDHITPHWVSLPIHLRNAVSVYETHWICWEQDKSEAWVREPPGIAITDEDYFPFFRAGMEFEEFVPEYGAWFGDGEECACFVGIRTDESLNRFRTIANTKKQNKDGLLWTTKVKDGAYNIYPIYDWKTEDIWIYHAKNGTKPYNRLYDMMHLAGMTINQMRICQPYGDDQRVSLWLYHLVEPDTWARVVARVNGANSGALYVQQSGNMTGYRRISKPEGHTWQSFATLLVSSMPPKTREHYENKIILFVKWWAERGYEDGIPQEADYHMETNRLAPSWRRVCKSLLRNDYWCKGLGFSQHKSIAYGKYLDLMRRRKEEWQMNIWAKDGITGASIPATPMSPHTTQQ